MTTIATINNNEQMFTVNTMIQMSIADVQNIFKAITDNVQHIEYTNTFKTIANINNPVNLFVFESLVKNSIVTLDDILTHENGNPIHNSYTKWARTWRAESSKSALTWRDSVTKFVNLKNTIMVSDLNEYIIGLSDVNCMVYDCVEMRECEVARILLENEQAVKDSKYINSIGRSELQTIAVGNKVVIK
jgi:transposase-like protein